jgi:ABC-2 type transport system ATP-binding protein
VSDANVIEIADLRKSYDGVEAVAGLSLAVPRGAICGLLGRNGAGKTTTIKMLLGMVRPTSGTARVFDLAADDPKASVEIRRRTSFVSDDKDLYDTLTVSELMRFTAAFYPHWNDELAEEYLEKFALPEVRPANKLSRGMRTKLALLLAMSSGAELLILDEPTAGLDPVVTDEVLKALVAHVARGGVTVFLSSHQLADIEQIADRVAIIDRGRTVLSGDLDDIRTSYRRIQIVFDGDAPEVALRSAGVIRVQRQGRVLTVLSKAGADGVRAEVAALKPVSVDELPVTLKDIFLETVVSEA